MEASGQARAAFISQMTCLRVKLLQDIQLRWQTANLNNTQIGVNLEDAMHDEEDRTQREHQWNLMANNLEVAKLEARAIIRST